MRGQVLIACLLSVLLFSMTTDDKRTVKFKNWYSVNHSVLTASSQEEGFKWSATYLPKEVKVLRAIHGKEDISTKEVKLLNEKFGAYTEFSFKIELEGARDVLAAIAGDEEEYNQLSFYLIESIKSDFVLVRENDEIEPLRCSYENNYGAAPFIKLHLVFENSTGENRMQKLVYFDQLTNQGIQEFDVSHISELKIPKIK